MRVNERIGDRGLAAQTLFDADVGLNAEALMHAGITQIEIHQQGGMVGIARDRNSEIGCDIGLAVAGRRAEHGERVPIALAQPLQHLGAQHPKRVARRPAAVGRHDAIRAQHGRLSAGDAGVGEHQRLGRVGRGRALRRLGRGRACETLGVALGACEIQRFLEAFHVSSWPV